MNKTTNNNPGLMITILLKYPYLSVSSIFITLVCLVIHSTHNSNASVLEQTSLINTIFGVVLPLLFWNIIAYFVLKRFVFNKNRRLTKLDKKVQSILEQAGLTSINEKGELLFPNFDTAENETSLAIYIEGLPQHDEKKYEKAIPVFENILDLDVTDWNYSRGRVQMVFNKVDLEADYFYDTADAEEYLTLGIDTVNGEVHWHYNKFPHMLLVGGTGSGKSTMFKSVIAQMSKDWELLFCDPKQVEFAGLQFEGYDVSFSNEDIQASIDKAVDLMEERYSIMRENRVKEYRELNGQIKPAFLIIDEFAAFFSLLDKKVADEYTKKLRTLVQKGRAAGVQLILMTQKPSSKVLDTDTRDNLMCQVAMGSNKTESYVMAFGDEGRECRPLSIGQGYYNIGQGIRKMKTYNLAEEEFIGRINGTLSRY